MEIIRSSQYIKLIELRHRRMGLDRTCRDTQSQVQSEQKAGHIRDTIVARGSL